MAYEKKTTHDAGDNTVQSGQGTPSQNHEESSGYKAPETGVKMSEEQLLKLSQVSRAMVMMKDELAALARTLGTLQDEVANVLNAP